MNDDEMPLPLAAVTLRLSWMQAYRLMTAGKIGEPRNVAGRWLVPRSGVAAYLHENPRNTSAA